MGKALKLVQKIDRRAKLVKSRQSRSFDHYDKTDEREEKLAESGKKAYPLMRKVKRRLDRAFGEDMVGQKPRLSKRMKISTVERHDYGVSDFGIRITMAAGLIADIGLRPGDIVLFLSGALKGKYLKVVAITDSTHARLEDVPTYVGPESNIQARFQLSDVKARYR